MQEYSKNVASVFFDSWNAALDRHEVGPHTRKKKKNKKTYWPNGQLLRPAGNLPWLREESTCLPYAVEGLQGWAKLCNLVGPLIPHILQYTMPL